MSKDLASPGSADNASAATPSPSVAGSPAGQWQLIRTAPRDQTVLVTVVATSLNGLYFGKRPASTHPAYIDPDGQICDPHTWAPHDGLDGAKWTSTHWRPMPDPAFMGHFSDCAVHSEPAYPNGPCDCGQEAFAMATGQ